jgi:hypothetical protein
MEGNGKLWNALPRIRRAKTRFDCALMARPAALLKDNGFDFTEAVDPALRRAMKPCSGEPGRRGARAA